MKVILVDLPRMLHDVIGEVVSHETDLDVVDEGDPDGAMATNHETGPCVVITRLDNSTSYHLAGFFSIGPQVRVLALSPDGREGVVYEPPLEPRRLGEISPSVLLAAIRDKSA